MKPGWKFPWLKDFKNGLLDWKISWPEGWPDFVGKPEHSQSEIRLQKNSMGGETARVLAERTEIYISGQVTDDSNSPWFLPEGLFDFSEKDRASSRVGIGLQQSTFLFHI